MTIDAVANLPAGTRLLLGEEGDLGAAPASRIHL